MTHTYVCPSPVENPTEHAANLSLLFSLPLGAQLHYDRACAGDHLGLGSMTIFV